LAYFQSIFTNCIRGILKNKTRILVTHQAEVLSVMDHIIYLNDGHIVAQGAYGVLLKESAAFGNLLAEFLREHADDDGNIHQNRRCTIHY
jgi:ABC-type transport system involved in cytochrome bd biosynthesis fused ATPase/permease subunit